MNNQREESKPAVILDGRVNATQWQRKIIVGDGNDFGNLQQKPLAPSHSKGLKG